jgi:hypothetical protein
MRGMLAKGSLVVRGWQTSKAHGEEAPQRATTGRGRRNSIQGPGTRSGEAAVERRGGEAGERTRRARTRRRASWAWAWGSVW